MKLKRKPKPHIPQSPAELTASWFTERLAAQSGGARVTMRVTDATGTAGGAGASVGVLEHAASSSIEVMSFFISSPAKK